MAFTQISIEHRFINGDGSAGTGKVTSALSKRMSNAGVSVMPCEFTKAFDPDGSVSFQLLANDDTGTVPTDAQWEITIAVAGAEVKQYFVTVSAANGTTQDLASLLPEQE